MRLEYLIRHLHDPSIFLYLERYVDAGSKSYSPFADQSEVDAKYKPTSDVESFEVPCLEVPKEKVAIYLDNPNNKLFNHYIKKDKVLFPVHPEIFADDRINYIEEFRKFSLTSMRVAPTSSTRTVMTTAISEKGIPPHFIKLHYPRRISRFIRRLRKNNIESSIEASKDLEHFSLEEFSYLPETIGITYGSDRDCWGFIIRENIPRPKIKEKRFLIPLFALYSQDLKEPKDLPILVQIIQFLNKDPQLFTLNYIMKPIIHIWCTTLIKRGLLLEMHAQNTLLELDIKLSPRRIVYRDLDINIDQQWREKNQLQVPFPKSHLIKPSEREGIFSLQYDGFIGHHLFDYLSALLKQHFQINQKCMQDDCKMFFRKYFPDADNYFGNKTYYYANEIFQDNKYELVESGDPHNWR